ncbi:MAG: iron-sulfur protein [Sandaracinus sp.]|nr:iron-sulfur protein [Sandaracinus sp.]|tara:strand:+ start:1530 stop:3725 length:2196 start_codon:yes stop_codon:yes gene_type:complete
MNSIAMTLVLVGTLSFFSWSMFRRMRQVRIGQPDARFQWTPGQIFLRTRKVMLTALGQEKMVEKKAYAVAGLSHVLIFAAFNVLLLNSVLLWGRGYDYDWTMFGLLDEGHIVGKLYSLIKELAAAGAMVGALAFWYLRIVKKGKDNADPEEVRDKPRMTLGLEPNIILAIIFTMMAADFLYVGGHEALHWQVMGEEPHWHWWAPFGSALGTLFYGMDRTPVVYFEHIGFWWHAAWVLLFLNILPYSKHFHIITVMPNVFAYDMRPNALPAVHDIEGRIEREEAVGIEKLSDLTYSHILDLYTCTECGRCSDNCPAYITDKKLSPKHLTLALRDHLYASEGKQFGPTDGVVVPTDSVPTEIAEGEEIHTFPRPPENAYFLVDEPGVEIVPNILHPDVIWSCTSCRACEEQCPVMISYVDKIIGMRREMVMMKGEFPPDLQRALNGIGTNGNPWNQSRMDRDDWTKGLDIPLLADHPKADVLYWVGCAASYDDRAKKIARSTALLLQEAGVDFAVLGTEESCTGDPARRIGDEYTFQMMAESNVETLAGYEAEKKTIITACPHCFNTLLNEYPDFGGKYDVVHHSDFLNGLLQAGKLTPSRPVQARVVYHDSCYLGRYNKIYDSPRQVLEAIEGVVLEEVDYWKKEQGLCCGAGGAQYFMEETGGTRVNKKRTLQLLETKADTIASACPFCMTMLTDGLKAEDKEDVRQLDIAELLAEAVGVGLPREVPEAAE